MAITLDGTNGVTTPDLTVDTDTLTVDTTNNRVGIGTSSPDSGTPLHVQESDASLPANTTASALLVERAGNVGLTLGTANTGDATVFFGDTDNMSVGRVNYDHSDDSLGFWANNLERMRIDSSGNVAVTGHITQAAIPAINLYGINNATFSFSNSDVLTTGTYMSDSSGDGFSQGGMSWNSTNGRITVPIAGVYRISAFAYINGDDGRLVLKKNGSNIKTINGSYADAQGTTITGTTNIKLAANDYITFEADSYEAPISIYTGNHHTGFSMEFVG